MAAETIRWRSGSIRAVSYSDDPHADPFSDRIAQAAPATDGQRSPALLPGDSIYSRPPGPSIDLPLPTPPRPGTELLPPPVPSLSLPPVGDQPPAPPLGEFGPSMPAPAELPSVLPPKVPSRNGAAVPSAPPSGGMRKPAAPSLGPPVTSQQDPGADCRRVYNERNCCDEDEKCSNARLALRDNPITRISLDITASFKPDAETEEAEQTARDEQLDRMPARQWKNRSGEVVADGRLVDVRNRRIVVANTDGGQAEVRLGELSDDDLCFMAAWWGVPTECTLGEDQFAGRYWEPVTMTWKASAICHKPLYFEEVQLERYGHTTGPFFEPVVSGAHFFLNIAALPYKMGINPPLECQYTLGYYRPGSCAPWMIPPVPISVRGGLLQAGAVLGVVALFP